MKFKTLLLSFTLSLFSMVAIAGGGHDHGHGHSQVDQTTAKVKANKIIAGFVKQKKLNKSWAPIPANSAEKKTFKGKQEWVVTFVNEKMTDAKKRKLYVFLTLSGDYVAVNYTGE